MLSLQNKSDRNGVQRETGAETSVNSVGRGRIYQDSRYPYRNVLGFLLPCWNTMAKSDLERKRFITAYNSLVTLHH